ncbi:MAG: hypothetical protein Q9160_008426 [Pyrenula sp. 1 TL-2023]
MNRPFSLELDDLLGLDSPPSPPALVPVRSRERSSRSRPSSITSDASRHAGSYWSRNSAPVVLLPTNSATYRTPSISSPPIPAERERSRGRPPIYIASALPPLPPPPIDVHSRPESPARLRSRSRNRRRRYRDRLESNEEDNYFRTREDQELDYDRAFSRHYDYDIPLSRPRRRSTRREYDDPTRSPSPPLSERAFRQFNRSRASYDFEDEDKQNAEPERREREYILRARARERDLEALYEQQMKLLKQMKSKVENQKVVEPNTEGSDPEIETLAEAEGTERRSVRFDVSSKEANSSVVSHVDDGQGSISRQSPSLQKDETSIEREIESLRQQIDQIRASKNTLDHQASLEARIHDERARGVRASDYERRPRDEDMQRRLRDEAEIAQLAREQILLKELDQLKREFRQKDKAIPPATEPASPQQEEQEARSKDGSFEHRVKETFLAAGYTEEETQRIFSSKQDLSTKPAADDMDDSKKRHVKVHRKYLLPETLEVYHLPWEWAKVSFSAQKTHNFSHEQSDPSYIIIKKFVEKDLMDELFQHTKAVKDRQAATGQVSAGEDRETLYIVRKKTDPSRSRRSVYF